MVAQIVSLNGVPAPDFSPGKRVFKPAGNALCCKDPGFRVCVRTELDGLSLTLLKGERWADCRRAAIAFQVA